MDFTTVVQTRRSVRDYADTPVPDATLARILEAARLAPSACNCQPWRFIVVKDADTRRELVRRATNQHFVAEAPVIIVCLGKRYPQKYNWIGEHLYLVDLGIAIEHIALAARNEGLGTCWIGSFHDQPIKAMLDIPADYDVVMLMPVGYPSSDKHSGPITERLPIEQIVFQERFHGR